MIVWIDKTLVLAIHDRQLAEHGSSRGVHDESLLASALARPQQLYAHGDPAPDLAALAASLAFRIGRNRPFVDGNKRAAHICYRVFIELNGAQFEASDEDKYVAMLRLAEGSIDEAGFAAWLHQHIRAAAGKQVHKKRVRYAR